MKKLLMIAAVVACTMLVGCERRPLKDPNGHTEVMVKIQTTGIPNITEHIYNPNIEVPTLSTEAMRLLIYDPAGEELRSQAFLSEKRVEEGMEVLSRKLLLSPDEYRLLSYNFDATHTLIAHEHKYNTIRAYTEEIPRALYARVGSRAEQLKIYYEPEHLFVARKEQVVVRPHSEKQVIEKEAETIIDTYYLQIRVVGGEHLAQNAAGIAVLSGLAHGNRIGENVPEYDDASAIYFELERSTDERIEGEHKEVFCTLFNTFGRNPNAESELAITLTALGRDGTKHEKVIDMTPIFATEDARERHWLLIDEVWEIPAPETPDDGEEGGFSPSVDDWDDIEEIIPI